MKIKNKSKAITAFIILIFLNIIRVLIHYNLYTIASFVFALSMVLILFFIVICLQLLIDNVKFIENSNKEFAFIIIFLLIPDIIIGLTLFT